MESPSVHESGVTNENNNKENKVSILTKKRNNKSNSSADDMCHFNGQLSNDSFVDQNFELSPKRIKAVATVSRQNTMDNFLKRKSVLDINFDDEFDSLSKSEPAVANEMPAIVENRNIRISVKF